MKFFYIFLLVSFFSNTQAQVEEIKLNNPSFEDFARPSHTPRGWYDCGGINFPLETPPDVHPADLNGSSAYGVTQEPYDGDTFIGMVIRENGSYESVSQNLKSMLLKGNSYSFSIALCMSENYKSALRDKDEIVYFTTPVSLRIWGGTGYCDTRELLAESPIINNTEWKEFTFLLQPKNDDLSVIVLEIFSEDEVNGNLLLDGASFIELESSENIDSNNELIIPKKSWNERSKIFRAAEREISIKGYSIKFKDNKLTVSGNRKIRSIANAMNDLPNHKLIIDLNGTKKKKAKLRKEEIVNVLLKEGLSRLKFEIRNTKEEDDNVKWLVDEDNMYIGILKIE